jgi:hypothetical protein
MSIGDEQAVAIPGRFDVKAERRTLRDIPYQVSEDRSLMKW